MFVVAEDDYSQAQWIEEVLGDKYPDEEIVCVYSESEFYEKVGAIVDAGPRLVLLDVMMRWAEATPNIPKPPDVVVEQGHFTAGFRCRSLLRATNGGESIHVLVYSIVGDDELTEEIRDDKMLKYLRKNADPKELIDMIESII